MGSNVNVAVTNVIASRGQRMTQFVQNNTSQERQDEARTLTNRLGSKPSTLGFGPADGKPQQAGRILERHLLPDVIAVGLHGFLA